MTVATDAGAVARSPCAGRPGHDPRPRLREPVQPVDRATRARGEGVLRAGSRHHQRRGDPPPGSARHHLQRRAGIGVRARRATPGPGALRPRHSDPRHLLRHAAARGEPRRRRGAGGASRVRARIGDRGRGGGALREASVGAGGVDVARRRRHRASPGFRAIAHSLNSSCAAFAGPCTPLRHPVPSRGGAHAARARHPAQLPASTSAAARARGRRRRSST